MQINASFLLILLSFSHLNAADNHQPEEKKDLLWWEYHANHAMDGAERKRKRQDFSLEYLAVPLAAQDVARVAAERVPGDIKRLSVCKKGQERYIRWFLNPEDDLYRQELQEELRKRGLRSRIYHRKDFAQMSASRSCFIHRSGVPALSFKSSTNHTGGLWQDKKVNGTQVRKAVLVTQLSQKIKDTGINLGPLKTLEESLGFTFGDKKFFPNGLNHGIVFRSYEPLKSGAVTILPGFAAIHSEEGKRLALLDSQDPDSSRPEEYWKKHYAEALGAAQAYFTYTHHLIMDSNHSQQYLIELDSDHKPTGKIYFRDYNDSMALRKLWHGDDAPAFLEEWMEKYTTDKFYVSFGIFHGSALPNWMNEKEKNNWENVYFNAYVRSFAHLLGVSEEEMRKTHTYMERSNYTSWYFDINNPIFAKWIENAPAIRGEKRGEK